MKARLMSFSLISQPPPGAFMTGKTRQSYRLSRYGGQLGHLSS